MRKWVLKFASYKSPNDIFDAVRNGTKTLETRPNTPKYSKIKIHDILVCVSLDNGETIEKEVLGVRVYKSIMEMSSSEDSNRIFPSAKSPEKLVNIFESFKRRWGKSYADKLEKYGVVVFQIGA